MIYTILEWNRKCIRAFPLLALMAVLMLSCSKEYKDEKALIPRSHDFESTEIKSYLTEEICRDKKGNYLVLITPMGECESCYPLIKQRAMQVINRAGNCRILVLMPEMPEKVKWKLLRSKLGIDTSKIKLVANTGVYLFVRKKNGDLNLGPTHLLEMTRDGVVMNYEKLSPK